MAVKEGRSRRPARRQPQMQNGSWCRHQPPLVPGPNAAPVRAWPLSWDRVPAEVLRPRSVPNQIPEGIRSGSPSRRTPAVSLSRPVSPKAPVSAGPSKKVGSAEASRFFFEGPTIASVACVPKDAARFRGGSHFGTSLPCGRNAPHREPPQWRAHPIRKSGILPVLPVDHGDIGGKSAPAIAAAATARPRRLCSPGPGRATGSHPGAPMA
jgi:hypothetical protein